MKTTNLEISKKLFELGFKAMIEKDQIWNYEGQKKCPFPAFGLETILEALPMGIDRIGIDGKEKRFDLIIEQRAFLYYADDEGNEIFSTTSQLNESLADCAARLLIELVEKGLVKLNNKKE